MEFSNINSTQPGDVRKDGSASTRKETENAARRPAGSATEVILSSHAREILKVTETKQASLARAAGKPDPKQRDGNQVDPDKGRKPEYSRLARETPTQSAQGAILDSRAHAIARTEEAEAGLKAGAMAASPRGAAKEDMQMSEIPVGSPIANRIASPLQRTAFVAAAAEVAVAQAQKLEADLEAAAALSAQEVLEEARNHDPPAAEFLNTRRDVGGDSNESRVQNRESPESKPGKKVASYRSAGDGLE